MLYQENILAAKKALGELLILLSQITDTVFFCQLASSVLMYSASRCLFFSALNATELLLKLRTLASTGDMLQIIVSFSTMATALYTETISAVSSGHL